MPRLRFCGIALVFLTAGCAVGPNYRVPDMQAPGGFAEARGKAGISERAEDISKWWETFGDPLLDQLVVRALAANPDMEIAASRVREARLQEVVAGASFWPTIRTTASAQRSGLSSNAISLGAGLGGQAGGSGGFSGFGLPGTAFNSFQLGLDATWQLDLFGKTSRTKEAARADSMAQVWELRDTQVSLAAEVASAYLGMRFATERAAIAKSELDGLTQTLHLLEVRASGGLANELDVRQQQAQVAAQAAALPVLEAQVNVQKRALALLLGEMPESFELDASSESVPAALQQVPAGLPSDLLRRRPDIRREERKLASANAKIGAAVAELYPQFKLTASPSLSSSSLRTLVESGSQAYSLGGSILWPLFNGGQTRVQIEIAKEKHRQSLLTYRKTVITALKEVDDALAHFAADSARLASLEQSRAAAERAEQLARNQYRGGLIDFSRVLTAEGARLVANDDLVQGRAAIAQDWVALYKALGGGWREEDIARDHLTQTSGL